jgi:6-phosphofructokinase 1
MIEALKKKGINQLYLIGGDGTHRGIQNLQKQLTEAKVRISICGIPKTIDNDIPLIDRSFGFHTAV